MGNRYCEECGNTVFGEDPDMLGKDIGEGFVCHSCRLGSNKDYDDEDEDELEVYELNPEDFNSHGLTIDDYKLDD